VARENVEIIRRGVDAINRKGPDALRELAAPEIVAELPEGLLDAGRHHGLESVLRVWHAYADEFEHFEWIIVGLDGVADRVLLCVRERGRGKESGVAVDWLRWWVFTLRDGLVTRAQCFLDEAAGLRAANLSGEAQPSR
jgi:ketosteroid isomerase-like protein